MTRLKADVVVVGGGPSGSTAATLLAKAGHSVIQLEREHHPRHQIGESLLPSTVHGVCRLLDLSDEIQSAGFVVKRGGTFQWGRKHEPWSFTFKSSALSRSDYSFHVERAKFDAMLFENARRHGVAAHEGVEVLELISDGRRAAGLVARDQDGQKIVVDATFVLDASGHGSRLSRYVGTRVYSDFFRNVAVYGYFHGAGRLPDPNGGNVLTSAFAKGWCWFIPLRAELTSVGAVVDRQHAARIGRDREGALMEFVEACPIVHDLLRDADRVTEGMYGEVRIRKDWSYLTDRLTAPGILLVGDAACFVDPVFSSGVHLATYGAVLAARTIATMLAGEVDEQACMREFERRYRREFSVWYEFLVGFFDLERDWDDHFWTARRVLNTSERANEAFINLVAGAGTAPEEFFDRRAGRTPEYERWAEEISDGDDGRRRELNEDSEVTRLWRQRVREDELLRPTASPLFDDGLIPTPDGQRWMRSVPELVR